MVDKDVGLTIMVNEEDHFRSSAWAAACNYPGSGSAPRISTIYWKRNWILRMTTVSVI